MAAHLNSTSCAHQTRQLGAQGEKLNLSNRQRYKNLLLYLNMILVLLTVAS